MVKHGGEETIVFCHNPEAFLEGRFMVSGSHAFFQIVYQCEMRIEERL